MLMCVCVCEGGREITLPFCTIFYVLVLDARCQLPTHTHSLEPGACKCVYYLQSLDSKEQEMFFLLLSPSRTNTHSYTQRHIHTQTTSVTPFLFLLVAGLTLSWHKKRLKEFIRVYFILVLNIFSGPLHYCFCVKAWESKHENYFFSCILQQF